MQSLLQNVAVAVSQIESTQTNTSCTTQGVQHIWNRIVNTRLYHIHALPKWSVSIREWHKLHNTIHCIGVFFSNRRCDHKHFPPPRNGVRWDFALSEHLHDNQISSPTLFIKWSLWMDKLDSVHIKTLSLNKT